MTRNGKIARLPRAIRDQLNQRLQDGETGETLLPWLNGLPAVQTTLASHFEGVEITKQNLSEWRTGGFAEWSARQDLLADAQELAADANEPTSATAGRLADHLATVLTARYASALASWNGEVTEEFRQQLKILKSMCQDVTALRRGDHSAARVKLEREQLEEKREKTQDQVIAQFQRWATVPPIKDWICQDWVPPEERCRRLRTALGRPLEAELRHASLLKAYPKPTPEPKAEPKSESGTETDTKPEATPTAASPESNQSAPAATPVKRPVAPSPTEMFSIIDPPKTYAKAFTRLGAAIERTPDPASVTLLEAFQLTKLGYFDAAFGIKTKTAPKPQTDPTTP